MKYALIHGTRICQLVTTSKDQFPVAADLQWVEVADGVTDRDSYVNGRVVKEVPPPTRAPLQKAERVAAMLQVHGLTVSDLKAELNKIG